MNPVPGFDTQLQVNYIVGVAVEAARTELGTPDTNSQKASERDISVGIFIRGRATGR